MSVPALILAIINAIGVEPILRIIAGGTDRERIDAILDAEYAAVAQAAIAARKAKFKK
jgi:hypothetical protein